MTLELASLKKWFEKNEEKILKDFFSFLSIPSVSTDIKYKNDVRKTALWLIDYLKNIGFEPQLWETSGHPVVFGSYTKAGKDRPTLLIYQHYDVQPADPVEKWTSDPFKPVMKEGHIYARGAADNKGQCFYSLTALKAALELAKQIKVNIKIIIEGEEETGSAGTETVLPQKKEELKADYLLVIDFDLPEANVPGITLGMRGITAMNVECKNSSTDLHSGLLGGIVLNPNRALVTLLSKLWDSTGKIAIPGFYDVVETVSKEERAHLDTNVDEQKYRDAFGINAFAPEPGYSLLESNWLRPSLEINGISGGYSGPGFKTVIPAIAHAKISCRLVPNQDPEKVGKCIEAFLQQHAPTGIEIKVELHHGAPAYRSKIDSSIAKIAAKAYEETFGRPCKFQLCGASVPIVTKLVPACGAEAVMMGCGLPEDNIHAPDEHFGWDRFRLGFLTVGRILALLSEG